MVQSVWRQVAGPAIAKVADPTAEREGVLSLVCTTAAWAQELDLMSAELIDRLNEALGAGLVVKLRCHTGQL